MVLIDLKLIHQHSGTGVFLMFLSLVNHKIKQKLVSLLKVKIQKLHVFVHLRKSEPLISF